MNRSDKCCACILLATVTLMLMGISAVLGHTDMRALVKAHDEAFQGQTLTIKDRYRESRIFNKQTGDEDE